MIFNFKKAFLIIVLGCWIDTFGANVDSYSDDARNCRSLTISEKNRQQDYLKLRVDRNRIMRTTWTDQNRLKVWRFMHEMQQNLIFDDRVVIGTDQSPTDDCYS